MSLRIIACGVFRDALRQIRIEHLYPKVRITYITPVLHNYPARLKKEILNQVHRAKEAGDRILCLYGRCYPELDVNLDELGIPRIPGQHCYEILLGSSRFNRTLEEEAGTYFVEKELVLNFSEYCAQPLELNDPEMREAYFRHYTRLAYLRQPFDSDSIMPRFHDISKLLNLRPMVLDVDYSELKNNLLKLFDD